MEATEIVARFAFRFAMLAVVMVASVAVNPSGVTSVPVNVDTLMVSASSAVSHAFWRRSPELPISHDKVGGVRIVPPTPVATQSAMVSNRVCAAFHFFSKPLRTTLPMACEGASPVLPMSKMPACEAGPR